MRNDMDDDWKESYVEDFQAMLFDASNHIRRREPDAKGFVEYFTQLAVDGFFQFFDHLHIEDDDDLRCTARLLAIQIWNATPLPSNQFRPLPVPVPGRNDPCLCGSGKKFKQCCARMGPDGMIDIPPEVMTALILETVKQSDLKQAWQYLSHPLLAHVAVSWLREDEDWAGRALMLLDPIFKQGDKYLDHRDEMALDAMFEICDLLDKPRKKTALLQRFMAHPDKILQVTALQRQCTVLGDKGLDDAAWACFQKAQRLDPDNPSLSHLELLLLMQQGKTEQMQQRGNYWLKRLEKMNLDGELDALIELIGQMISDTPAALAPLLDQLHPGAGRLIDWLQRAMKAPPGPFEKIEYDDDLGLIKPGNKAKATLLKQWNHLMSDENMWKHPDKWLVLLEKHPELAGSIVVIDDLIQSVYQLEIPNPLMLFEPLIKLAMLQVKFLLPKEPKLPFEWVVMENRPALRVLGFLAETMDELDDPQTALEIRQWLLRLNPGDNQGMRSDVVNDYLRAGRNREAAELCSHYPEDFDVSVNFGYALALFRLGEREAADKRLIRAMNKSPRIADAVLRKRMKKPDDMFHGYFRMGGEYEAWLYHEDARDLWQDTPDALRWLKQTAKTLK